MAEQASPRPAYQGTCALCGGTFSKGSMTRHLTACITRQAAAAAPAATQAPHYHVIVQGRRAPEYWLHLAVRSTTRLRLLDEFLRDTWLECCGHLSEFTIGQTHYSANPEPAVGHGLNFLGFALPNAEKSMNVALNKVLQPGGKADYEYDFGTTTELTLRVLAEYPLPRTREAVRVLARNDAPVIFCDECGAPATDVCSQCIWEGAGWLCKECGTTHECGQDMLLPVVNSPRVGMCGYTG